MRHNRFDPSWRNRRSLHFFVTALALALSLYTPRAAHAQVSVQTRGYDAGRTGWNPSETQLTPQTVGSGQFGALATAPLLDDQIDAQPLVLPNRTISGQSGRHDVVYVATASNTLYAIDANNASILLGNNFGAPVPSLLGCGNNGQNIGITGTPVYNPDLDTINFIAYTLTNGVPTYRLHAVSPSTLRDAISPITVQASNTLKSGLGVTFNAGYQRQRPALLYNNGAIYAAFGSFCDLGSNISRGWLLGWSAATFQPLAGNDLTNRLDASPNNYFLSSIWMSGAGPAADSSGNVYFSTGNSDPSGTSYNGLNNLSESVVKAPPDLLSVSSVFTPSNIAKLDQLDADVSAAGLLKTPDGALYNPPLLVAGAKDGRLFVLNAGNLGGFNSNPQGPDNVLAVQNMGGGCWCAPAFFLGADGIGRIVSSGGLTLQTWRLTQNNGTTSLVKEGSAQIQPSIQDGGFFTTVSSNGTNIKRTGIIWAVGRPNGSSPTSDQLPLYAFGASPSAGGALPMLTTLRAGHWPNAGNNSSVVPVVANGKVYVASYKQLIIFGLAPAGTASLPDVLPTSVSYDQNTKVFSSMVTNQGVGPTPARTNLWVGFYVDGNKVGCGSVASIAAGATATVSSPTFANPCNTGYVMPPGVHTLAAFVDDVNLMPESDKTNNTISAVYPTSTALLPDLAPTFLSYDAKTGLFASIVMNQGTAVTPSGVAIGVAYYVNGAKVSCGYGSPNLPPGASTLIGPPALISTPCQNYMLSNGTYTISVLADDMNLIQELTRSNNQLTEQIVVSSSGVTIAATSLQSTSTPPPTTSANAAIPSSVSTGASLASTGSAGSAGGSGSNRLTGKLVNIDGSSLTLEKRDGAKVVVDDAKALKGHLVSPLVPGFAYLVTGSYDGAGVMTAESVTRAKDATGAWLPDI